MLNTNAKRIDLTRGRLNGITFLGDENVQESLGAGEADDNKSDIVLLTNKRVIHISGPESAQNTSYAALEDISAVELTRQPPEGYGSFIWAGLAFFVAVALWRIIENQTLSIAAAAAVALMGAYLIIDRLTSRGGHSLVFKAGGAEIRCALKGDGGQAGVLIARLFELKEQRADTKYTRSKSFSPR